ADVDPYFHANALISLTQEAGTTDFGVDPEEVYFETISIPLATFKAGKFKAALGKENQLHTHAFPFIDPPLINDILLGDEGLNEMGVSASVLLPAPWFMEVTAQGIGTNNDVLYNPSDSKQMAWLGEWRNLWDVNDDLTLEWNLFGTGGANQF